MINYFVKVDNNKKQQQQKDLYDAVRHVEGVEYEGVLNMKASTAMFTVDEKSVFKFKKLFPVSTPDVPHDVPHNFHKFYSQ